MTQQKPFGGAWTQDKLERLHGYLEAYMHIFKDRPYFQTVYVDAFAGTGRIPTKSGSSSSQISMEPKDEEVQEFLSGSARIALIVEPPFGRYLFIEQSVRKAKELEKLKQEYPEKAGRIDIVRAEYSVGLNITEVSTCDVYYSAGNRMGYSRLLFQNGIQAS